MGAAPIPLGLIRTSFERVILLGDAACQVKPWSGGGIVWSFAAAEIAARKIRKALKSGDMGILEEYDREWKAELAPLIRRGMRMGKFYRYAPGTVMRLVLMLFSRKGRLNRLDMDFL